MNDQHKKQLQNAALMLAEHQHKGDKDVAEIRERLIKITESIQKEEAVLNALKRDQGMETLNLRKALLPYIPEDLRD